MSIAQPCQTAARALTETTAAYRRFLSTLSQQPTQCIFLIVVTETFKFSLECIWLEPGNHACPCVGVHRPPGAWLDGHTPVIRRICWCIHHSTTHSAFLGPRLATIPSKRCCSPGKNLHCTAETQQKYIDVCPTPCPNSFPMWGDILRDVLRALSGWLLCLSDVRQRNQHCSSSCHFPPRLRLASCLVFCTKYTQHNPRRA